MADEDFREVGASGRRYSRAYVLETLEARQENTVDDEWQASEFHCRELATDLYLLTYTLLQGERLRAARPSGGAAAGVENHVSPGHGGAGTRRG